MANLRANTYESGSQGTTIDSTNSAGGGDAFDVISIGAGNTLVYDNTNARDTLAGKYTGGGTTTGYHGWDFGSNITAQTWFRVYFAFSALPTTGTWFDCFRPNSSTSARCGTVSLRTDGLLRFDSGTGTEITTLRSTTAISPNTMYRLEWRVLPGAAADGELDWWLYTTPDAPIGSHAETKSGTSLTLSADIRQFRLGNVATPGNITGLSVWFDNVAASSDAQIGPATAPPSPPAQQRLPGRRVRGWF